jgi:transposase
MEMLGKVRRMHYRDGLSRSEIARRTGLSRNTVKKWLKAPEGASTRYRRESVSGKLEPFQATLIQALEADARRPKRDRRTAKALLAELRVQGDSGGYTVLTDFIRDWRLQAGANAPTRAFVPLKFELGEAFQFDWSEEGLVIGGIWRKLLVAHLKLCASRAFVLVAYPSQGHEMLFDAHTRSFAVLGGIPRRGIYDNMKTAVDRVKKGKGRVVNARFAALCAHYLFDADFCNVASGWGEAGFRKACFALPQPARCANRAVGRGAKVSSRRTCRIAGGASGKRRAPCALVPSRNSILGCRLVAGPCGRKFATRSTTSRWPRCWSMSNPT